MTNARRGIESDSDLDVLGQLGPDMLQSLVDLVDDRDAVRTRLWQHCQCNHGVAIALQNLVAVLWLERGPADIPEPYDALAGRLDDRATELLRAGHSSFGLHRQLGRAAFNLAGRQLDVLTLN